MNGWILTPKNKERKDYDFERALLFEARAIAYDVASQNPVTESEADRLHELIEEALSYETGLPFLALSDTVSIAITPKVARFMDDMTDYLDLKATEGNARF